MVENRGTDVKDLGERMIRPINTRSEFAKCVRDIGGEVLDERQSKSNDEEIADYWFPRYETIGELKCLEADLAADPEFSGRITQMVERWVREGKIPESNDPRIRINLKEVPVDCAREFLSVLKRKLESTVRKANSQIKITKARLSQPDAKGLLIFAIDGNLIWKPDVFTYLVPRILAKQFTSIHSATYFSCNRPVTLPGVPFPSFIWIDGKVPGREPPPEELRLQLQQTWTQHHASLMKRTPVILQGSRDPVDLEQIQFVEVPDGIYRFY